MRRFSLGLLLLGACTSSPSEGDGLIAVGNRTSSTIVVYAIPNGHLIDPMTVLQPGTFADRQIEPGRTGMISPGRGYTRRDPLTLLIYVVRIESVAELVQIRTLTGYELMKNRQITVRYVPSPRDDSRPAE